MGKKQRSAKSKKPNPFDLKHTIRKTNVVGRSGYQQNAAVSSTRKKSFAAREQTLGRQLKKLGNQNQLTDRRIGQKNRNLSAAEKAELRFVSQRKRLFSQKNKFVLGDEDPLDGLANTLTEAERYQRLAKDHDDGGDDSDLFVASHFGGGNIQNTKRDKEGKKMTRKEMLEQIIRDSKEAKATKQKERELQFVQWQRLDKEFDVLKQGGELVFGREAGDADDDYLNLMHQLQADPKKAVALDPKKDPTKRAEFEARRVETDERKRLERMETEKDMVPHVSADDDSKHWAKKDDGFELKFGADGQADLNDEDRLHLAPEKRLIPSADDEYLGDSEVEEASSTDEDEFGDADFEDDDEAEDGEEEEDEEEEEDALPALGEVDSSYEGSEPVNVPASPEQVADLLASTSSEEYPGLFEAILKANHPRRNENNKAHMSLLLVWIIDEYMNLLQTSTHESDHLLQVVCTFSKNLPDVCAERIRELVRSLSDELKARKRADDGIQFAVLGLLRLVRSLFSFTDRVHTVCVPVFALASTVLSKSRIGNSVDCLKCLLLCNEMTAWLHESKRFCPEVLSLLLGVLMLACKTEVSECFPSLAFPVSEPHRSMLHVVGQSGLEEVPALDLAAVTEECLCSPHEKHQLDLQLIRLCVRLVTVYADLYTELSNAYGLIFGRFLCRLKQLPRANYPAGLRSEIQSCIDKVDYNIRHLPPLKQMTHAASTKIRSIDFLEPKIETHFDAKHPSHRRNDPKAHEKRLSKKLRTERRGVVKELRADAKFLSLDQRRVATEASKERIRKTNKILAGLQGQESEYQKRKLAKK